MTMAVIVPAGQQPGADDIHHQTQHGDRDRFVEADRDRMEQPRYRFIADQQGNHRQHDGAAVSGEVAEFAGAEAETAVVGIFAGKGISQRREQQRAGMRGHVQPVGDQGQRAEQRTADDFGDHHDAAQDDHSPGAAFCLFVIPAQKHMVMGRKLEGLVCIAHRVCSLEISVDHFDELIGRVSVQRAGILVGVYKMGADVVFHHLGHQSGDAATNARNHVHDALAFGLFGEGALNRFDLAANATDARRKLLLVSDRMRHE